MTKESLIVPTEQPHWCMTDLCHYICCASHIKTVSLSTLVSSVKNYAIVSDLTFLSLFFIFSPHMIFFFYCNRLRID